MLQIIKQKIKAFNLKAFIQTPLGRHLYSFVKTYLTVFLGIYLMGVLGDSKEGEDIMLSNMAVIIPALKWSFIAVLRNIWKILTEK